MRKHIERQDAASENRGECELRYIIIFMLVLRSSDGVYDAVVGLFYKIMYILFSTHDLVLIQHCSDSP